MYEVEAKVALTATKYERLKKELSKKWGTPKKISKTDFYLYADQNYFLRVRKSSHQSEIDLKRKTLAKNIESNQELSWPVKSSAKALQLLKKWGIESNLKKVKHTESFCNGDITIELNHIESLGYFLEIETLVQKELDVKKAQQAIKKELNEWGFNQNEFEKKYYYDLLKS